MREIEVSQANLVRIFFRGRGVAYIAHNAVVSWEPTPEMKRQRVRALRSNLPEKPKNG